YDDVIRSWEERLSGCNKKTLDLASAKAWEDAGKNNMILRSDMAYELGGASNKMYALGSTVITGTKSLVPQDEVILVGKDIPEISQDTSYARLTVVYVDEEAMGEGDALYSAIRNIEYVRYQISPKGFMMRVSTTHNRESVRVSKEAIAEGLTFSNIGKAFVDHLHKNPKVKSVRVYFITDAEFNFESLEKEVLKAEAITKTIDHVFKDMSMDCNVCNLKQVCDEVEGLRELHFKQAKEA
ncbi:MAG: carbon monoxide dehydrogenase, partial [Lachnospiraceae bacterium]|nr:carbon monoxide dehydrogenase [Lachnospiraceae bacterium]